MIIEDQVHGNISAILSRFSFDYGMVQSIEQQTKKKHALIRYGHLDTCIPLGP